GTYRLFNYTGTLTGSTLNFGTLPAGFTAPSFTLQTSVANQVNLIVAAAGPAGQYWDGANMAANGVVDGGTGIWNTSNTNWTSSTGAANTTWQSGVAVFSAGAGPVGISTNITATEVQFLAGAGAYNITATPNTSLNITGTGITNTSGLTQNLQTFSNVFGFSQIIFANSATSGAVTISNPGSPVDSGSGGHTFYGNSANAAGSTIFNFGGSATNANGGLTQFQGTASAMNASITNYAGTVANAFGGVTEFTINSTAANATITNNGPGANGFESKLRFLNSATAANATINNNGGTNAAALAGSTTTFNDTSTAASAIINNNVGLGIGGATGFNNTSTAATATITNFGASGSNTAVGNTQFYDSSNGGNAIVVNQAGNGAGGGRGGFLSFNGTSLAGSINSTNQGASTNGSNDMGRTSFNASANAQNGVFLNKGATAAGGAGGGQTVFFATSSSGSATITNEPGTVSGALGGEARIFSTNTTGTGHIINQAATVAGAFGGDTAFRTSGNGAQMTIDNNGSGVAGAGGGTTTLINTTNAGNATFNNNAGTASGAAGGSTTFVSGTPTAGNATLIANGGTGGALGGSLVFQADSTGGTSTVKLFGNGHLDIDTHNAPGLTIGSLEGTGNVFLGANNLTVGSNDTSTLFSGVVQNGAFDGGGGIGGSFAKTGTGTLTVSGVNIYTGATAVNSGKLLVNGSLAAASAVTVASGATLGGTGAANGAVSIANGGILAPGASPGTITLGTLTLNSSSILAYELGTPGVVGGGVNDLTIVNGALTLDGVLNVTNAGGFAAGTYRLFNYAGALTDQTLSIGTLPIGFNAANFTVQTSVPGQVNLTIAVVSGQHWDGPNTVANAVVDGGTATWNNVTTNWTNAAGTANAAWQQGVGIFSAGSGTATLGDNITATELQFVAGSGAYTVNAAPGFTLTITGAGITNTSGVTQNFVTAVNGAGQRGDLLFTNNASAGTLTIITNNGGTTAGVGFLAGRTRFTDAASAGNATINNNGATVNTPSGTTFFSNSSTAGSATINNNPTADATAYNAYVSLTFSNTSNAGTATINNNGATASATFATGTSFRDSASALNAVINNNGGTTSAFFSGGQTGFNNTSTAGSATITNFAGTVSGASGGATSFTGDSIINIATAGSATIINNGPAFTTSSAGGNTSFDSFSSAGTAIITNNPSTVAGAGSSGSTGFFSNSTAGGATITNVGSATSGAEGGSTTFLGGTAGSATINNNGGTANGALGGSTSLGLAVAVGGGGFTTSTGANSIITNNAGTVSGALGGTTTFSNPGVGGSATIINNGAAFTGAGASGTTTFDGGTAESATITNEGASVALGLGGSTIFNTPFVAFPATAASAKITNNGGTVAGANGGSTEFFNNSTAGSATITSKGGADNTASGTARFNDTSTAGNATLNNIGGTASGVVGGATGFLDNSTAGSATITNSAGTVVGAFGGATAFRNTATAGSAAITSNGAIFGGITGGSAIFYDTSTAGGATLTNLEGTVSGAFGGFTAFNQTATAGSAAITNTGATVNGAFGGATQFFNTSTAGNATITTRGGTAAGANGGTTTFNDTSNGGSATLITHGGTNEGLGGTTEFFSTSDGGLARAITNGNGRFDISGLTSAGMGIGSIEGSGEYYLGTKTLTTGGNNLSTTVSGTIESGGEGGGALTKIGTGALTLTGINTYNGPTNVNGGALIVNGSIASANVFVNAGGTLGGSGTVLGHVMNSGIVSPGNSPGTLNIGGNYVQTGAGTLAIEIASRTSFDQLAITGSAALAGTLRVIRLNGYQAQVGDTFKILTAGGGVTGTFGTVNNDFGFGSLVRLEVVYEPGDVLLTGVQNTFANAFGIRSGFSRAGLTPNQIAVALTLDSVLGDPRQSSVVAFLNSFAFSKVPHQLDAIAAEELTSIYTLAFAQTDTEVFSVQQRLADIRAAKAAEGQGDSSKKETVSGKEERFGFFITGTGDFASSGDTYNSTGFNQQSAGTTLGVDMRLNDHFVVGLTLGYAYTNTNLIDGGSLTADTGKAALYAMYQGGGFHAEALVGGGYSSYDIRRGALGGAAVGRTDGAQFDAYWGAGYDLKMGDFTVTPIASMLFTQASFDAFDERGSLQPLHVASQQESSLRSRLGVRASCSRKVGLATITPSVSAQFQHEFLDTELPVVASFGNGAGGNFTVHGPKVGRDSALLSAAVNVAWRNHACYVAYQADVGRKNYESQTVLVGFRTTW
ncbi:MAG: hypothetical protein ABIP85_00825, partial [Chthoniobacteraceae bacterium]